MALVSMPPVDIAAAGIKGILSWVVGNRVDVAADGWIFRVSQELAGFSFNGAALFLELGVLAEGVGDFHGFPAIG